MMRYQVLLCNPLEVWRETIASAAGTTYFHTPEWSAVLEAALPAWRSAPIVAEFADGNSVVIPRMKRSGALGWIGYSESMLPAVYGGPVFRHPPSPEHWEIVWQLVNRIRNTVILGNPFVSYVGRPRALVRPLYTHVLDLTPGYETLLGSFRRNHRTGIRLAQQEGVEVAISRSRSDVDALYEAYVESLARWGKEASGFYPRVLFELLFASPDYGNAVRLWVARKGTEILGGGWVFTHRDHAVYWHSTVFADHLADHTAQAIAARMIREACAEGLRWFDFNPSGGLKGVEHFKDGFRCERKSFESYRRLDPLGLAFRCYQRMMESWLHRSSI